MFVFWDQEKYVYKDDVIWMYELNNKKNNSFTKCKFFKQCYWNI